MNPPRPGHRRRFGPFLAGERGAVTVDWVVLTGAAVGLCIGMFAAANSGVYTIGETIGTTLSSAEVQDLGVINDW